MFTKLNLSVPTDIPPEILRGAMHVSYGRNPRISYYKISDETLLSKFIDVSKLPFNPTIRYSEVVGFGLLPAHRDAGLTCCINYYINTNNCTTTFYEERSDTKYFEFNGFPGARTKVEGSSKIYDVNTLTKCSEFTANDGDVYLLDVQQIHSVYSPKIGMRKFITVNWDTKTYEEVKKALYDENFY